MAVQDVKAKCKRDFWSAYAAELLFWPAFQAVNFWKIPVRHQLLAVNLACLLDATFLCWCAWNAFQACRCARSLYHLQHMHAILQNTLHSDKVC